MKPRDGTDDKGLRNLVRRYRKALRSIQRDVSCERMKATDSFMRAVILMTIETALKKGKKL